MKQIQETNALQQQHYMQHMPYLLKISLNLDRNCDEKVKTYLVTYARNLEQTILMDGQELCMPKNNEIGLTKVFENMDPQSDFGLFMSKHKRGSQISFKDFKFEGEYAGPAQLAFKQPLSEQQQHMTDDGQTVPLVLALCCEEIEKKGLSQQGIYRLSGSKGALDLLLSKLDQNCRTVNFASEDPFNVAIAVKQFVRDIPGRLIGSKYYGKLLDIYHSDQPEQAKLKAFRETLQQAPPVLYTTMRYLFLHLTRVIEHSEVNKMDSHNLAVVFHVNLFPDDVPLANFTVNITIVDMLLKNAHTIFF
eukprot:Colp12_sorted_trinity150504_noHs@23727